MESLMKPDVEHIVFEMKVVIDRVDGKMKVVYRDTELQYEDYIAYYLRDSELEDVEYLTNIAEFLLDKVKDVLIERKKASRMIKVEQEKQHAEELQA